MDLFSVHDLRHCSRSNLVGAVSLTSLADSGRFTGSIHETVGLFREHDLQVTDHIQSVLAAITEDRTRLRAFVSVAGDDALKDAEAADKSIRKLGREAWRNKPLLGITAAVKDLIQTSELPTRRGSLLPNERPRVDAPSVARLKAAGVIIVGKTATSEHGWSASTASRVSAPTRNPWVPERSAGGSSGGSAAAVSAGLCAIALGTDGAGSIRIPASFCGVVGFKPSFGRIPYVPPCADRLSHLGPLASTVSDVVKTMAVLEGPHGEDPDSGYHPAGQVRRPGSLRMGWIEFPGTTDEVREVSQRAVPVLAEHGHRIEAIDVPFADPYPVLVDILAAAEAADLAPADEYLCDPGRVAIAQYGRALSAATMMRAEQARLGLRARLALAMKEYDLLAMATVGIEPFDFDAIAPSWAADPADLLWLAWSRATYPFNLTGQPSVSLPVGLTSAGVPVGLQLVGAIGMDDLVLATAGRLEIDVGFQPAAPDQAAKGRRS